MSSEPKWQVSHPRTFTNLRCWHQQHRNKLLPCPSAFVWALCYEQNPRCFSEILLKIVREAWPSYYPVWWRRDRWGRTFVWWRASQTWERYGWLMWKVVTGTCVIGLSMERWRLLWWNGCIHSDLLSPWVFCVDASTQKWVFWVNVQSRWCGMAMKIQYWNF